MSNNRIIKFRGKSIRSKKWFFGGIGDDGTDIIKSGLAVPVDRCTVGQFTGLYDVDGKEIFEGDILQHEDPGGKVYVKIFWDKYCCVYFWKHCGGATPFAGKGCKGRLKWDFAQQHIVIGNIYDNPELLKEGVNND